MRLDESRTPLSPDTRPAEALPAAAPPAVALAAPRRRRLSAPEWVGILLGDRLSVLGLVILAVILLMAIFAPLLTPYAPGDMIALPSQPPSPQHWFGTNHQGQDLFSQVAYGARSSLFIGGVAGL